MTVRSTTANSRPRVHVTVSVLTGTVSVTSSAWKYGRPRTSHLRSIPSGNQAPPVASVTDQRAQRAARNRSEAPAVGSTAAASDTGAPSTVTDGAASTSTVATPAPPEATVNASPATTTATSRSTPESTTTSSGIGTPATTGRRGPWWTVTPSAPTRTTTTPAGGSVPTTSRTACGQSPVSPYAAKTSPSAANRAQRNISIRSSPQSQPRSACRPR